MPFITKRQEPGHNNDLIFSKSLIEQRVPLVIYDNWQSTSQGEGYS